MLIEEVEELFDFCLLIEMDLIVCVIENVSDVDWVIVCVVFEVV